VEDIKKGTEEQMSFLGALNNVSYHIHMLSSRAQIIFQNAQFDHTISPRLRDDDSHIRVTRGLMTRNIGSRYSDLMDEINRTLEDLLAGADKGRHKYGS